MSEMQSSFDARSRFVILWILAALWFPLLMAAATPWLVQNDHVTMLRILSFLSVPIAALCQMPLLRGRVENVWLWLLAGVGTAILFHIFFNIGLSGLGARIFPERGGGLSAWLPYFLLTGLLAGLALALPQAVALSIWKLGGGNWILIVLGAAIIAAAISGVIWVMGGMGAETAEPSLKWAAIVSAAVRQIAFGAITGLYLWRRLMQRSVDAAARLP